MSNLQALVANAEAYAQRLSRRNYNRVGIEMFLALEDLQGDLPQAAAADVHGQALASAAERIAQRIVATRQEDPVRALRLATEVLAAHVLQPVDLDLVDASPTTTPDPAATGEGRPPLRLPGGAQTGVVALVEALQRGRFVRTINFHNTAQADAETLQRQFYTLSRRYQSLTEADLIGLMAGEPWQGKRPPLLLTFYEGLRNSYDVAAPLLEAAGLRGWFCLIPGFLDTPLGEQRAFAAAHHVRLIAGEYEGERVAMRWAEVRDLLTRGHEVVCHTMTHTEPSDELDDTDLKRESLGAVSRLETELGRQVATFVWWRGVAWGEYKRADVLLQQAGVSLLLSNFKLQRLPKPSP